MKDVQKTKLTYDLVEFGDKAMDLGNDFVGIVTGKAMYSYEEPQVLIENLDSTGRPIQNWVALSRTRIIVSDTCIMETRFPELKS